jgi:copper chaperone CopZ
MIWTATFPLAKSPAIRGATPAYSLHRACQEVKTVTYRYVTTSSVMIALNSTGNSPQTSISRITMSCSGNCCGAKDTGTESPPPSLRAAEGAEVNVEKSQPEMWSKSDENAEDTPDECQSPAIPDSNERGCCSTTASAIGSATNNAIPCHKESEAATSCQSQDASESHCEDDCCAPAQDDCQDDCCEQKDSASTDSCCPPKANIPNTPNCCSSSEPSKGCCTDNKKDAQIDTLEVTHSVSDSIDLEKGVASKEHIVLSISGMTCTGCETKLKRTLGTLAYVSNLKTSLVLARAELDIIPGAATADDIIKHLQRTTEFKCELISSQGTSFDLICSVDPASFIEGAWPDGVLDVTCISKDAIRVNFDPKIIGARDLLEQDWAQPLHLAPPRPDASLGAGSKHVRHMAWMTLLSALLTIPVLVLAWAPLPEREIAYGSASLALATIVQVVIAGPFYPKAVKALVFSKVIEMDLLIVLSTSAAYIFSVVSFGYLISGHPLSTGEFFETSTLLVTLIMVGRWVASLARQKAAESISIRALQAHTAVLAKDGKCEMEIDARLLQFGDMFKVAPDSRIPTDGTVVYGESEIDESMLTGESRPVVKTTGSTVIAGSINGMGERIRYVETTRICADFTHHQACSWSD